MKKLESYQCVFCNKIYKSKSSLKSHKHRCDYNPNTRSCATCVLLIVTELKVESKQNSPHIKCMLNKDLTKISRTRCNDHLDKNSPKAQKFNIIIKLTHTKEGTVQKISLCK